MCKCWSRGCVQFAADGDLICISHNSLWPCHTIWRYRFGSTLAQAMAWCLAALLFMILGHKQVLCRLHNWARFVFYVVLSVNDPNYCFLDRIPVFTDGWGLTRCVGTLRVNKAQVWLCSQTYMQIVLIVIIHIGHYIDVISRRVT